MQTTTLVSPVDGLVEILRDRAGVPHVYAGSTADAYFGLGLAMAQDRLWQMDRLRRRALGRQAEILGPEFIKSDLTHLLVEIDLLASAEAARLEAPLHTLVEAFVGGINRWIEHCFQTSTLPVEFHLLDYAPEPFTARDVIAILRGMWWSLNGRLEQLVAAEAASLLPDQTLRAAYLTPEASEERIVAAELLGSIGAPREPDAARLAPLRAALSEALQGTGDATGSNNWAVAAARTVSGQAMLCSDPHQPFWLPSSWYEYALHGPEDHVAGAGHPGVPGIWFGSNGRIAWGITNNAASIRDLYVEDVNPQDDAVYRDGETWRRFEERVVTIPVRGAPPHRCVLRRTGRGPIMNDVLPSVAAGGDPPLALRWVGQEHLDDLRALLAIGRAQHWNEFREALRGWSVPVFNFGYADRSGVVAYQCAGRVPVRGRVVRGYRQAGEPRDRWLGYVPFDALPRIEQPRRGYIATANNRVAPDTFPSPLHGAWAAGHRAIRLRQALDTPEGPLLDRHQMMALQNDVKSCRAERLCPPLLALLTPAAGEHGDVRLLCDALRQWDYCYTPDSAAALLFEAFMQAWQARVAAERFPARLASLVAAHGGAAALLIEHGTEALPWFEGGPAAMRAALLATAHHAVDGVRERLGPDSSGWRWAAAHIVHWRHVLSEVATAAGCDVGPAPVDGCADTVRNTGTSPTFEATSGAEYRLVVDFATPDRIWAVQNAGNSGVPGSAHYADQFTAWLAGRYHVVYLDRTALEADLESRLLLRSTGAR